ncbi:diguanylate cyclase (GGDEF) domain-containing protein [Dyella jiangningensis]|uniref:GGDEF domain-containing protein n=1 Tax=Dyella sp. AtDHG13 TaxID=1938897 RepID=UPI00088906FC|nr:GGDEF domain-containing protein [Dyella sp. AtDHG13]PXV59045.1 diguanylate cyclase (GGDEF)-like protein [Dyella sp. AtDHG13]SDL28401.1 diguanylate cyclase (GGDEF) domain-containing protein [Dyella jiangningensis]
MPHPFAKQRRADDTEHRREYTHYLAQRMAPAIRALTALAVAAYLLAAGGRALLSSSPVPLPLRLAPVVPLAVLAVAARRERRPLALSLLALACVLLLEVGVNLNGIGQVPGQRLVLPGLLLPVASSVIWIGRWDFIVAMLLCALGPLPMLMLGSVSGVPVFQYAVYMTIAISVAAVLRAFITRTLFEQFRLEKKLREQAHTDGLTGLLQRNRFLELARYALSDIYLRRMPAALLYLDADHFKQLNDAFGHEAGDQVLIQLASGLRAQMRDSDLIGRVGGEEFVVLLCGVNMQHARSRAERLREAVRVVHRPDRLLTVSVGIVCCDRPGENIESLISRADQAMRLAKKNGRDQVVVDASIA